MVLKLESDDTIRMESNKVAFAMKDWRGSIIIAHYWDNTAHF